MPKFLFFDNRSELVNSYKQAIDKLGDMADYSDSEIELDFFAGDVRKLIERVDVFVSPANSHGYMDGGIDAIYSMMFPGVQQLVQREMRKHSQYLAKNHHGQVILSIGSALVVDLGQIGHPGKWLICAPTMEIPHSIRGTPENAYWAMLAILKVGQGFPNDAVIGVPGLGTGVGGLTGAECGEQMRLALEDVLNFRMRDFPTPCGVKFSSARHFLLDKQFTF